MESLHPGIHSCSPQLLLDPQQPVVFLHPLGAAGGAGLDLAGIQGCGQVGDGGVAGLAGAVGDDGGVPGAVGQLDGLQGLGEGADLVELDEDGIAAAKLDALGEAFGVGDEEIVAYQLDPAAQLLREKLPALPVLLVQGVLDGEDGITVYKLLPVADEGLGGKAGPGFWEKVFALPAALPLAGGGVHSQHKSMASIKSFPGS